MLSARRGKTLSSVDLTRILSMAKIAEVGLEADLCFPSMFSIKWICWSYRIEISKVDESAFLVVNTVTVRFKQ